MIKFKDISVPFYMNTRQIIYSGEKETCKGPTLCHFRIYRLFFAYSFAKFIVFFWHFLTIISFIQSFTLQENFFSPFFDKKLKATPSSNTYKLFFLSFPYIFVQDYQLRPCLRKVISLTESLRAHYTKFNYKIVYCQDYGCYFYFCYFHAYFFILINFD